MQKVRLPPLEKPDQVWSFMEILFEELRCEMFYEAGPTEKKEKSELLAMTIQAINKSENKVNSGDNVLKRKLDDQQSTVPNKSTKLELNNTPLSNHVQQQQQPRPRGRPVGSKNKIDKPKDKNKIQPKLISDFQSQNSSIPTTSATSTPTAAPKQPTMSPTKKLPIYHNAHKMYESDQFDPGEQPPVLRPEVMPKNMTLFPQSGLTLTSNPAMSYSSTTTIIPNNPTASSGSAGFNNQPVIPKNNKYQLSNLPSDPNDWNIDQVIGHITLLDPSLGPHVEMFRSHEIDGKALLLLTDDMMMKYMDMKLGPAVKISNIVNMLQGKKHLPLPT